MHGIAWVESTRVTRSQSKPSIYSFDFAERKNTASAADCLQPFHMRPVLSGRLDFRRLLTPQCVAERFSVSLGGFECRISRRLCREDQFETINTGREAKNALMWQIFRQNTTIRRFISQYIFIYLYIYLYR